MRMSSTSSRAGLVNNIMSFKMADVRPVSKKQLGTKSVFKTKITRTTAVPDSAFSRQLVLDQQGWNKGKAMQKDTPKKGASVGPLPSPPCTPPRHSHGARSSNVFQGVQHRKTDREVPHRSNKTSTRPGSAFTPYSPLPGIGNIDQDSEITAGVRNLELNKNDRVVHSPSLATASPEDGRNTSEGTYPEMRTKRSSSLSSVPSNNRKVSRRELRSQQFARRKNSQKSFSVPDEPSQDEKRLLIALKLPEGDRVQRYFRPSDSVSDIVSYVEKETGRSFSDCNVFTSDIPKRIIPDPSILLSDAGFGDRTLLYLEEKDE